jgi:hypothetical protein
MVVLTVVAGAIAGTFAACGGRDDPPAEGAPKAAGATVVVPTATVSPARADAPARLAPTAQASPPAPEPLVALATADAARRTGVAPGDVRIVRIEGREWPDRSLGCPRPGMGYAQAITPGYLIVAEAAGQQFEYHTDHAQVVLCAP